MKSIRSIFSSLSENKVVRKGGNRCQESGHITHNLLLECRDLSERTPKCRLAEVLNAGTFCQGKKKSQVVCAPFKEHPRGLFSVVLTKRTQMSFDIFLISFCNICKIQTIQINFYQLILENSVPCYLVFNSDIKDFIQLLLSVTITCQSQ